MNLRAVETWLRASLQPATLFGLAMIAVCWIGLMLLLSVERNRALEGAIQQSENLVHLFEENTAGTFERLDRTILLLRKSIEDAPDHFNLREWAEHTFLIGDRTIQLALIGPDGNLKATTLNYEGAPPYLGDRDHFRAHLQTSADNLFISKPVLGRSSGKWSIQVSRRVRGPYDSFGGVIVISIDPNFVDTFYDAVDLGTHGTVAIRNLDGVVLARRGVVGTAVGSPIPQYERLALTRAPSGYFWSRGSSDGIQRLIAFRASDKFPLIFSVGRADRDIFAAADRHQIIYYAVAAFFTVLVLVAIALSINHQIRLNRIRDNLARSEVEARQHARELEVKSREIVHIAHHDQLTGLANRALLHDHIEKAFARAQSCEEQFAILCVDLDRFKAANDTLGHQSGDVLLRLVGERLRQCVREVDTVARIGGDEFVVLQTNVSHTGDVTPLAERILLTVSAPYDVCGNPVVISASIGIAVAPADGATTDKLFTNADLALYRAKANGRNDLCFFNRELEETVLKRARIELELRDALVRDEFELWYQPWFNVKSGRIMGCEALLRWRHPTRGLLGPAEFLAIAEETGQIASMGDWVLRRGCRDAMAWPASIHLAINLSAAQFVGGNLYETVVDALADSGLAAGRLELEITETLIIEDFEGVREPLSRLRQLGVGIALDDFGTGYSSLTHLSQLLFDRIKIDKSFVAEIITRSECQAIVSAVIALGKNLGVAITAEGVETQDQLDVLRGAGCVEVQGYFFSRPIPGTEIAARLVANKDVIAA
jgi:diguanylate cyclase (GGDEF)-like protein